MDDNMIRLQHLAYGRGRCEQMTSNNSIYNRISKWNLFSSMINYLQYHGDNFESRDHLNHYPCHYDPNQCDRHMGRFWQLRDFRLPYHLLFYLFLSYMCTSSMGSAQIFNHFCKLQNWKAWPNKNVPQFSAWSHYIMMTFICVISLFWRFRLSSGFKTTSPLNHIDFILIRVQFFH